MCSIPTPRKFGNHSSWRRRNIQKKCISEVNDTFSRLQFLNAKGIRNKIIFSPKIGCRGLFIMRFVFENHFWTCNCCFTLIFEKRRKIPKKEKKQQKPPIFIFGWKTNFPFSEFFVQGLIRKP